MKTAIITGASAGLGIEYLKSVLKQFPEVECIWLIARRKERLEELAASAPEKKIVPVPLDLTSAQSISQLKEKLAQEKPEVQILVNNAGFGTLGDFIEMDTESQARMVDLNVRALTEMTSLVLPYMKAGSFVVNVCSIASFVPNPRMTVYCSTKAYVLSFSKSLREELKPKKINVLAVCPGPMATEFLDVAHISGNSKTFERLPYCDAKKVAECSLKKAAKGKAVCTPHPFYQFYRVLAKLLPHNWLMKLSKT